MATMYFFDAFVENLAEKVHDLGADTLKLYLTNNAPSASAHSVKADLVGITAENGYTEYTLANKVSSQTGGTYTLSCDNPPAWTATGAGFGPFRYVVLYNDTPTSPADPLIAWWDYGSSIAKVAAGETFDVGEAVGPSTLITLAKSA